MTYYALSSTGLNWLTFNKNVNKYAHNRLLLTSSSSQCRYIQCWTGPEQRHSMVLVSTTFSLLPLFSLLCLQSRLNGKLAALDLQKMPSVNDQVAPAHHNHNQSYHPFYSVTTWKPEKNTSVLQHIHKSSSSPNYLSLPKYTTSVLSYKISNDHKSWANQKQHRLFILLEENQW